MVGPVIRAVGSNRAPGRLVVPLPRRFRVPGSLVLGLTAMILFTFAVTPGAALAAAHAGRPTVLDIRAPATVQLGGHVVVTARLTESGRPVRGQQISIRLGSKISKQVTTGADGRASTEIARDLSAGRYNVTARFAGTSAYRSSTSRTVQFIVEPVRLTIATVPATPGLQLLRIDDGAPLVTGPDGTLVVSMKSPGQVALRLALPPDNATRQVRLERWDDGSTDPVRTIRIPDTLSAVVGLQILHPVQFGFTSADGSPIPAADVPTVRITDDAGNQEEMAGAGAHWLRSNAITRLTTGLISSPVTYRVAEVPLGGENAVNQGQQRFVTSGPQTVTIGLLAFDLVVQGRDALLKSPWGSKVTITDPAGGQRVLDLDADSSTTTLLPRGQYTVKVDGGFGIPITTPVALSREQHADVLVLTMLDIAVVVGIATLLVVSLILIGRPHFIRRRRADTSGGPDGPGPPLPQWPEPNVAQDWRRRPPS
jgi:hypothetical protein